MAVRHLQEHVNCLQLQVHDLQDTMQEFRDTIEVLRARLLSGVTALQQAASSFHAWSSRRG